MSRLERLVQAVRPGVELTALAVHDDEAVRSGGGEVFRLPLAPTGSARLAVLVAALPVLRSRVPVALAVPAREARTWGLPGAGEQRRRSPSPPSSACCWRCPRTPARARLASDQCAWRP